MNWEERDGLLLNLGMRSFQLINRLPNSLHFLKLLGHWSNGANQYTFYSACHFGQEMNAHPREMCSISA